MVTLEKSSLRGVLMFGIANHIETAVSAKLFLKMMLFIEIYVPDMSGVWKYNMFYE